MIAILASLLGSKAGRIAVVVGIALASAALLLWQAFRKGAASERAVQTQASLRNLQHRVATDDTIERLPRDARRERLREWLSDKR